MLQFCTPVIYASVGTLTYHRKALDAKNFNFTQIRSARDVHHNKVNLKNCWEDAPRITLGQASSEGGKYALISLQDMVEDAKAGLLDAIVTAPIDKHSIQSDQFAFPGHTEFLTQAFGRKDSLMFMCGEHFRIGLVTGHVPLNAVSANITTDKIIRKLQLMHESLVLDFNIRKPRIAVLALNPHAGELGLLGNEEQDIIIPALEAAKRHDIIALGPFPADGFFGSEMYKGFDGILAMYHDQGLIPFKLMNFETGVNFTAGLPIIRTSPDHGTAYSIAGKNEADESSFRYAVYMAADLLKNRRLHEEVTANPLRSQLVKEKEL
jgi:4-hydroxythreonine-4-phosphate dehydrogenase